MDVDQRSTQPLGALVDAQTAKRPERTTLRGRTVTLVPLDAEAHADVLFRGANGGEKDRAWTYLPYRGHRRIFPKSYAKDLRLAQTTARAYMDAAVNQLSAEGYEARPEDIARLSPLGHKHVNMLGRYAFTLPDTVARDELRPLRDPQTVGGDEA